MATKKPNKIKGVQSETKQSKDVDARYEVKADDDIATLATAHHISVGLLKSLNGLSSNQLRIGMKLKFK